MSENIVLSFALWFGAVIALICSIYVALTYGARKKKAEETNNN